MRIGRKQKTITFILAAFFAIACALLSAKLVMDKYNSARYSRENIQSANTENSLQQASQGTNNGFWADYSSDEIIGLVIFAGFIVAVFAFCFVWIISLAIALLTGGTSKLSPARY